MIKKTNQYLNAVDYRPILKVVAVYVLALLIFLLFRLVLFFTQLDKLGEETSTATVLQAFVMGLRFDTVIICYIMAFPFLLLSIQHFFPRTVPWLRNLVFWLTFVLFTLSFVVSGADIPYFDQFFSRFSITAFEWMDSPVFVFKMIFEEPRLWLFIIPALAIIYLFYRGLKIILLRNQSTARPSKLWFPLIATILFLGVIFIGMRGRLDEKSPIRVGTAYFSDDPLLNQLGLNPNFTLLKSYLESKKSANQAVYLMDSKAALKNTMNYLGIAPQNTENPLKRELLDTIEVSKPYNVIVVMMESMSAAKMERHGNKHALTPFLDSLSYQGAYFEHAYSAGIHTFNGIYSTLFGYPAFFRKHPMKMINIPNLGGMGSAFKSNGYQSLYFTTHDGQFDNVEGFLKANDYDKVISKQHYPSDKVKTTLGVPDDYMFEFAMPLLDEVAQKEQPFFAAFMTASDHKPYYIPPYFSPKSTDVEHQIVEYADYSLQKLVQMAKERDWYANTLFVFVADHGAAIGANYDITLAYNHVPLLFFAPSLIQEGKTYSRMAGQIDVFSSVMGLLNLPHENASLGVNLFEQERPYIYFNVDDKYGVVDQEWLLIVHQDRTTLHRYSQGDKKDYAAEFPEIVHEMKLYATSQMQVYQDEVLLRNR